MTSMDLKAAVNELAEVDAALKEASKQSASLRKRRTELRTKILEHMTSNDIDEITDDAAGVKVCRTVTEKAVPLSKEHVVDAVAKVMNATAADGERVFAVADRARPTRGRAGLNLKKLAPRQQAEEQDDDEEA